MWLCIYCEAEHTHHKRRKTASLHGLCTPHCCYLFLWERKEGCILSWVHEHTFPPMHYEVCHTKRRTPLFAYLWVCTKQQWQSVCSITFISCGLLHKQVLSSCEEETPSSLCFTFLKKREKWQPKKLFLYKKKRTTSSQTKSHWAHTHTHLRTMKLCLSCKTVCWNVLLPWHAHIKKKKMLICLSFALIWGFAYASVCVTAWKRKRKGTTQLYSVLC